MAVDRWDAWAMDKWGELLDENELMTSGRCGVE